MSDQQIRMRGGSGLGDAIYQRPIAEYFVRKGNEVTVCSDYPDVFLGTGATVEAFRRDRIDVVAHYSMHKRSMTSNQWQDVCASAQVGNLKLETKWETQNSELLASLREKAAGRPLVLVHAGRTPMNRTDGFGKELLPAPTAVDCFLYALQVRGCFRVAIGSGTPLYPIDHDYSLWNKTSVGVLMDLGANCDAIVGQASFIIPLAEIFDKPLFCLWAHKGLHASHEYVRQITPQKVLSKPTSFYNYDDQRSAEMFSSAAIFTERFFSSKVAA